MQVGDVMTTKVVAVRPETPVHSIAQLLFTHGISAVPVIDESGAPIGMVSEGDLMPRDDSERNLRRDWWLRMLSEGEELSPEFVKHVEDTNRTAREIMSSPAITIAETASLIEVAERLSEHRVKRLPVVRNGRVIGIISRADIVQAVAAPAKSHDPEPSLDRPVEITFPLTPSAPAAARRLSAVAAAKAAAESDLSAAAFRALVEHFEEEEAQRREEARHHDVEKHQQEAREIAGTGLTDEKWNAMLNEARKVAQSGRAEHLLLRFPCDVCTDHGRAINAPDANWPETLQGLPAQIFMRWKEELRSRGFGLHARVIDFPDGLPGDIGLFLVWGK